MIRVAIYNHASLYNSWKKAKQTTVRTIHLEHVDDLNEAVGVCHFDIVLIHGTEDELNLLKTLAPTRTQLIFMSTDFTINQVKGLLALGAYDCLELPIAIPKLIDEISRAYTDLIQLRKLKTRDEKYLIQAVRESLGYDLIYGNAKHAKEIWERGKLANLPFLPNTVLLLSIDNFTKLVRNKGEMWKSSLRQEVLQAINATDVGNATLKVLVNQQKYAVLLALPVQLEASKYKQLAIEYASTIQAVINRKTAYTVTIGIGNYYEDARNLHLSYEESEQAQTNRLFSKENAIIHIEDIDYFETSAYDTFKIQIQEMTHTFLLGDVAGVHKQWEEVYQQAIAQRHLHPEDFRLQVLDVLFSLSKSAIQNGANPKTMMPLQIKYAKELHEMETIDEINAWMCHIINEFMNHVNEAHNTELLKSVQAVLQFIDEHYFEDIGLDIMAEMVELSPNYLSAIFKQTTGSSFIDYLTDLRMKKAKEKLQQLHLSISEVAQAVGYSSSQYFSRVFKNNVGMTPSAYRNNMLIRK